jgi:hypothetical protein
MEQIICICAAIYISNDDFLSIECKKNANILVSE